VLEVQAALRGIKRNMNPAEPGPSKQQKERKNDTTQQPEQKQDRNYSQTGEKLILASDPLGPSNRDLPVVSVTTYRRFV
jgi:Sec-independent protein translocase protein TatA